MRHSSHPSISQYDKCPLISTLRREVNFPSSQSMQGWVPVPMVLPFPPSSEAKTACHVHHYPSESVDSLWAMTESFKVVFFFPPLKCIRFVVTTYHTHSLCKTIHDGFLTWYPHELQEVYIILLYLFYREESRGCWGWSIFVMLPIAMGPELIKCKACTPFHCYSACLWLNADIATRLVPQRCVR